MKCKVTVDTSHYPKEGPWELPEGWYWCKLEELCVFLSRGKSPVYSETSKEYPVYAQKCNLKEGGISLEKALFLNPGSLPKWPTEYRLKTGDVLVNSTGTGTVGRTRLFNEQVLGPYPFVVPDSHVSVIRTFSQISSEYVFILLSSEYGQQYFAENLAGSTNQKELYIASIAELQVPLPPAMEQTRIAEQVFSFEDNIKNLDDEKIRIQAFVESAIAKILDLAIHGKLVPQDPSDEPAIELLKRINPAFKPSDNLHYRGALPLGWELCRLEDILEYEQPQAYIVKSTDYSDKYITPVLTPGKSFVLGYTNESEGIYNALPVIIFDDFTTESKYVDFPFKVKSSAMKILRVKGEIDIRYVAFFMSITRLAGDTHKRYWISEYSKLHIPIPPFQEQKRIVSKIKELSMQLDLLVADTQ